MTYFEDMAAVARPVRPSSDGASPSLRAGQLGAVWALASHFTVSSAPAQAVLPTGVGKTAVMSLLPLLVPARRVLVIAPSRLVRDQVADEFRALKVLKLTGTVPGDFPGPSVHTVEHRLGAPADWQALAAHEVVTGTPGCLSPALEGVCAPPAGLFDLIIVDEAHHAPAPTWASILGGFHGVPAALLTATPFRRDRRGLPGAVAYVYPLQQAVDDGIYVPIDFIPVDPPDDGDHDRHLAEQAAHRLTDPRHAEAQSALLVRTDRINEAERLVEVYEQVGLRLGVVHSRQSLRTARRTIAALKEGMLRGIVAVGVLGEGFDLPSLKVAVYHRRHRSLPATLQFIGRLSRVQTGSWAPAELLAIRGDVEDETRALYAEDAAWGTLIPKLAQAAIDAERERREYVAGFTPTPRSEFSLHAVYPRKDAQLFELPAGAEVDLHTIDLHRLAGGQVIHRSVDADGELLVLVTEHRGRPDWLRSDALDGWTYELHLVVIDRTDPHHGLAYLATSSEATSRQLLEAIGLPDAQRVAPEAINRILWGMDLLSYSSVGMRTARAPGGRQASYRTLAGSAVNLAVRPTEARGYGVGHLLGRHRHDGRNAAVGASVRRAKVWAPEVCDLLAYKRWCLALSPLIRRRTGSKRTAPLISLPMPTRLRVFPAHPVAAVLHPVLLEAGVLVQAPGGPPVDLLALDVVVVRVNERTCKLTFCLEAHPVWACLIDASGEIAPSQADLLVRVGGSPDLTSMTDLLTDSPPTLYFANGASTIGSTLFEPSPDFPPIPQQLLEAWPWQGVDIRAEARNARAGLLTVQQHALEVLSKRNPDAVIFHDDGAGELADLVVVRPQHDQITVDLVHCKWSSSDTPGHRVNDLHEVIGQAVRSGRWATTPVLWKELARRLNRRPATRVAYGDPAAAIEQVVAWAANPLATTITISIVQPGLLIDGIQDRPNCNTLLMNGYEWLDQQGVRFRVIGSTLGSSAGT